MDHNTRLPPYLPFPRFLMKIELTRTAMLIYALLLARMTNSQKNGWADEEGRCFVIYPIESIEAEVDRGRTAVKSALNELSEKGLIERRRQSGDKANRIYVLLPDRSTSTVGKLTFPGSENRPNEGRKIDPATVGKTTPSKKNIKQINETNKKHTGIPDYSVWEGDSL